MRFRHFTLDAVMTGDWAVGAEAYRLLLSRQLRQAQWSLDAREWDLSFVNDFAQLSSANRERRTDHPYQLPTIPVRNRLTERSANSRCSSHSRYCSPHQAEEDTGGDQRNFSPILRNDLPRRGSGTAAAAT
jgi:hypothetical protein